MLLIVAASRATLGGQNDLSSTLQPQIEQQQRYHADTQKQRPNGAEDILEIGRPMIASVGFVERAIFPIDEIFAKQGKYPLVVFKSIVHFF
jgi:hypothetical protein